MASESDISPATSAWIEAAARDASRQIERLVRDMAKEKMAPQPVGTTIGCLSRALEAADYMAKMLNDMFAETEIMAPDYPHLYRAMCDYERFVEAYRKGGLKWETK